MWRDVTASDRAFEKSLFHIGDEKVVEWKKLEKKFGLSCWYVWMPFFTQDLNDNNGDRIPENAILCINNAATYRRWNEYYFIKTSNIMYITIELSYIDAAFKVQPTAI